MCKNTINTRCMVPWSRRWRTSWISQRHHHFRKDVKKKIAQTTWSSSRIIEHVFCCSFCGCLYRYSSFLVLMLKQCMLCTYAFTNAEYKTGWINGNSLFYGIVQRSTAVNECNRKCTSPNTVFKCKFFGVFGRETNCNSVFCFCFKVSTKRWLIIRSMVGYSF